MCVEKPGRESELLESGSCMSRHRRHVAAGQLGRWEAGQDGGRTLRRPCLILPPSRDHYRFVDGVCLHGQPTTYLSPPTLAFPTLVGGQTWRVIPVSDHCYTSTCLSAAVAQFQSVRQSEVEILNSGISGVVMYQGKGSSLRTEVRFIGIRGCCQTAETRWIGIRGHSRPDHRSAGLHISASDLSSVLPEPRFPIVTPPP